MCKITYILLFCLATITGIAQQVTNIRVSQEGDRVVIFYDLVASREGQVFDIAVRCSPDKGKNFSIAPQTLSGDLKGVTAGTGRKIVWDVLNERETLTDDAFVFQLNAKVRNPEESNTGNSGSLTDSRDGEVYKWVRIGTQIWMAENLKATKYEDGKDILNITEEREWKRTKTGAYCWYDNNASNKTTYGALYNCYAVNTCKLCPTGWHVPTNAEWKTLFTFLGGESEAGGKMKTMTGWNSPNTGATNSSGFSALPGGCRYATGPFYNIGLDGSWWSSSEYSARNGWYRDLHYSGGSHKNYGFSVRCVRDF